MKRTPAQQKANRQARAVAKAIDALEKYEAALLFLTIEDTPPPGFRLFLAQLAADKDALNALLERRVGESHS